MDTLTIIKASDFKERILAAKQDNLTAFAKDLRCTSRKFNTLCLSDVERMWNNSYLRKRRNLNRRN